MKIKIGAHPSSLARGDPVEKSRYNPQQPVGRKEMTRADPSFPSISPLPIDDEYDDINILFAVIESICLPFTQRVSINGYLPRR